MPSPAVQGAVSEYEHLNSRYSRLEPQRESLEDVEDEEEDFIPLKPPRQTQQSSASSVPSVTSRNVNSNNSSMITSSLKSDFLASEDILSTQNVPSPLAWSPGMLSGPSIFLTPQKTLTQDEGGKPGKENILEPHDTNQIPVPVAWSPGMIAKPNPSLFVTPEKSTPKYSSAVKDNFAQQFVEMKENLDDGTSDLKTKGKYSVRFDLPSMSGEESCDSFAFPSAESPITLKGQQINSGSYFQSPESGTPQWKMYSPQRSYDPTAYSDESTLEDSSVLPGTDTLPSEASLPGSSSHPATSIITMSPVDGESCISVEPLPEAQGKQASSRKTNRKTIVKTKSTPDSCIRKSIKVSQSDSGLPASFGVVDNLQSKKKKSSDAGPQFLKSALSQYDKKPPKPFVVRESKNKHVEADYSYPFDAGQSAGEAEFEHAFARPEYNSTLRVRSELDELSQQEVDVLAALQETLAKSEAKRTEMNEKASLFTNRTSNQFHNLVDLDTSVESLCDRIVRMRTSKAVGKRKAAPSSKKPGQADKAPDLMEFFSPELQRETPDLSLPGISSVTSQLMTSPHDMAFDLYRHNRLWNGINDF